MFSQKPVVSLTFRRLFCLFYFMQISQSKSLSRLHNRRVKNDNRIRKRKAKFDRICYEPTFDDWMETTKMFHCVINKNLSLCRANTREKKKLQQQLKFIIILWLELIFFGGFWQWKFHARNISLCSFKSLMWIILLHCWSSGIHH